MQTALADGLQSHSSAIMHQGEKMRFLFLAILLLLAGCTSTEQTEKEDPAVEVQVIKFDINTCLAECDGLKGSILNICQSDCYQTNAINLGSADECKKVEELMNSSTAHAVCLEEVAIQIDDASPCERLKNEFERDLCYITVAEALYDSSICDMVSSEGDDPLDKQSCLNKLG